MRLDKKNLRNCVACLLLGVFSLSVQAVQITSRVGHQHDDAEESNPPSGSIDRNSNNLRMGYVGVAAQQVGMRFPTVAIPQGATIINAYIDFRADQNNSNINNFVLKGEATNNAARFNNTAGDISGRLRTTASVDWLNVPAWTAGNQYQTTNITSIVQEIVNRVGWSSGNAMGIFVEPGSGCINSTCSRIAVSYNGSSATAPQLVVNYTLGPLIVNTQEVCGSTSFIRIVFSKNLNAASAQTAANYQINNGITILGAVLGADNRTVTLTTSAMTTGVNYIVTVNNVRDTLSNAIEPNSTTNFILNFNGLVGQYYDNADFTNLVLTRTDNTVNFNWVNAAPDPLLGADTFSVRWTGFVEAPTTGTYLFHTYSDDGVRLYVNGSLVINNWTDHSRTKDTSTGIALTAGQKYAVTLEFVENTGQAEIDLAWTPPSVAEQIIPNSNLFRCYNDTVAPVMNSATLLCSTNNRVYVTFNESVSSSTAQNIANYTINNGLTITSAALQSDQRTVILNTSAMSDYTSYTLTVNGIQDLAGNTIAANSTAYFTYHGGIQTAGLLGDYYTQNGVPRAYFTGTVVSRTDATVGFDWGNGIPITGVAADDFSVRWTGYVRATTTGNYIFRTRSDDGIRLYINSNLVINNWTDHGPTNNDSAAIALTAGQYYPVTMEFYERGGGAVAQLSWQPPSGSFAIIPASQLSHCAITSDLRLEAYYAMESASWNGTANEVRDASGNALHGRSYANPTTAITTPALSGNPGTCRYANFNNVSSQYLSVNNATPLNMSTAFTVATWINPNSLPASDYMTVLSKDENYEIHLDPAGNVFWWWQNSATAARNITSSGVTINPAGGWYHVAISYASSGQQTIYINGVARGTAAYAETLANNTDPLQIGSDQTAPGRFFNGQIDEVYIASKAYSATEIQYLMSLTHPCTITSDHIAISHAGTGITCMPAPITVRVHQGDHSIDTSYTGTLSLATSTGRGDWALLSGNGTVNNGALNDGAATYNLVGADAGQVQLSLKNTTAETVNINITDGSISETTGTATASEDANLVFSATGFIFRVNGAVGNIGTQIAGKASNVAPGNQTLDLQAIRTSDTTGACEAALIGNNTIQMAFECQNPTTCASNALSINGTTVTGNPNASISTYSNVTMDFGNASVNSSAVVLRYDDAGQIRLHARYNMPLGDGTTPSGNYMQGSSNAFVVRPFGVYVNAVGNPAATSATGSVYTRAGVNFTATATGVLWQAADDTNNDGIPDGHNDNNAANNANLSNNTAALNFGRESETLNLSANLILPSPGTNPILAGTTNLTIFNNGQSSANNLAYNEVGIIELDAALTDNDYLGSGQRLYGKSGYVGRFTPDHFAIRSGTTHTHRISSACVSAATFTYMEEDFQLNYILTAQNVSNATTQNYTGAFAKLNPVLTSNWNFGAIDSATPTPLNSRIVANTITGAWNNGDVNAFANITLRRSTPVDGPFNNLAIGVAPLDSDNIQLATTGLNLDTDNNSSNDRGLLDTLAVRYGRARLNAVFGTELLAQALPIYAEYFNGTQFIRNISDSCTSYNNSQLTFSNRQGLSSDPIKSGSGTFSTGQYSTPLLLNSAGQSGSVDVLWTVPTYLQFDWDNNGSYTDNPSNKATFGIYGGTNRQIYTRELY
ncbi:MAG: Ig-like domain-containing protein [Gammaproteobacteria bacterium]|nr:Ig-like domain-containing protein [Gammaproteobacteria bacterium]